VLKVLSAFGGLLTLAIGLIYWGMVQSSGDPVVTLRPVFVAGFLIAAGLLGAVVLWISTPSVRGLVAGIAGTGLLLMGALAIASIGMFIWAAASLIWVSAVLDLSRDSRVARWGMAAVGSAVALIVLSIGLYATEMPVGCRSHASTRGGSGTFFHGSYSYTCSEGRLSLTTR
jgi:hypothetical protein